MSLLGIDIGTTGCKSAAFSVEGQCLAMAYREYVILRPGPGQAELDACDVVEKIWQTISEVAEKTKDDPITALSVSSLGEAVVPVSADREVLGSSILIMDLRGGEYVQPFVDSMGLESFYEINPNIPGTNYSMPKLCWLRDNQPDLYEKADKFLLWSDLVCFLLGGEAIASFSLANRTLLFDIRKEDWSDALLSAAGLDREKLGRCVPAGAIVGEVSSVMVEKLGLPAGVKIVVGGHDQCCNSLGAGIYQAGRAVDGIGTFECITPTYGQIPDSQAMLANGLNIEHHLIEGLYVSFIYNQAGSLVQWFRNTFASADLKLLTGGEDIYDVLTAEMPTEPTKLLTLPYFEMTGTPGFVADASGVILGLKTDTTRGEILKSIMECVTLYFAGSLDILRNSGIDMSEFIATGGGSKSDAWLQIKADILGVPYSRLTNTEGGLVGTAMLAGLVTGVYSNPSDAAEQFVRKEKTFTPDSGRNKIYREKRARYDELFPLMSAFLRDNNA